MTRILCKWRLDSFGFCAREAFIPPFFVQAVGGDCYNVQKLGVL